MFNSVGLGFVKKGDLFVFKKHEGARLDIPSMNTDSLEQVTQALKKDFLLDSFDIDVYDSLKYKLNGEDITRTFYKINVGNGQDVKINSFEHRWIPLDNHDDYVLDHSARVFCQKYYRDLVDKKMGRPADSKNFFSEQFISNSYKKQQ